MHGAGHECSPPVHLHAFVIRVLGTGRTPLRCEQEQAGEKFCDADCSRIYEQAFECVLEAEADHRCRDTRQDDVAGFAELFFVASDAAHDDVGNLLVEHHEDGEERSGVEHDVEEHACFVHAEEFMPKYEVTGAGDREEFCEALQQAEDNRFKHSKVNVAFSRK